MRRLLVLASLLAAACGTSGIGGGSGGSGGSGGTGGVGGDGGSGGTGGSGACEAGGSPQLFLVPEQFGYAVLHLTAVVAEHRAVNGDELPYGAYGTDRLLALDPIDAPPEAPRQLLYYGVPAEELQPRVQPGDVVVFDYRLEQPWGWSTGVTLRTPAGALLWVAENGGFGPLGTGGPELVVTRDRELCSNVGDCGTAHLHGVAVSFGGGPAVAVDPGGTAALHDGDREGPFYLGSWIRWDGALCSDMPGEEAYYVLSLPTPPGCGPAVGRGCGATEFCDFASNECGRDGEVGACTQRPDICLDNGFNGVCGCDGGWHWDACRANAAGTDVGNGCTPPLDTFSCGTLACASFTEYCQIAISDVVGIPDDYRCLPLPERCLTMGAPSCACLADEPCGGWCTGTFPDLTLTCPGG